MKNKSKSLFSSLFTGATLFLFMLMAAISFDNEDLLLILVALSAIIIPFFFILRKKELKLSLLAWGFVYLAVIFLPMIVIIPPLWKKVAIGWGISYAIYLGSYFVKALVDSIREKNPAKFDKKISTVLAAGFLVIEFLAIWVLSYLILLFDSPVFLAIIPVFVIALYFAVRASGNTFSKPIAVYAVFYTLQQLPLVFHMISPEGFAGFLYPSEPPDNSLLAIDLRASFFLFFVAGITCLHLAFDLVRFIVRVIKKKRTQVHPSKKLSASET